MRFDVKMFCNQTYSFDFCMQSIGRDQRIATARGFRDVLIIAVSQNQKQVTNATTTINKIRPKFSGPYGKKRLGLCETKFKEVSGVLQKTLESAKTGCRLSLKEAQKVPRTCIDAMDDCKNTWTLPFNGPDQSNPLAESCFNVMGLSYITSLALRKLLHNRAG
ncbi:unnamed protein product [Microthlaspi erraticum]|uniref:Pectinesterase inhibitor domain-containing protein n=1 Tax=Microthlaspi erraticum TaxID=1685480 RepID=A0A6D2IT54_9BRAS|nr:unnamed protein product [Microthlaspi erraticum]